MSQMIDKVAQALYANYVTRSKIVAPTWDQCDPIYTMHFHKQARVAIEAMREPTLAMIEAAQRGEKSVWDAMIEEALR